MFGSNTAGRHGAGAALLAYKKFGAMYGKGVGLFGQSYAFPTLDHKLRPLLSVVLKAHVGLLYSVAISRPELTFLVTKVGCGLAGFPEKFMQDTFASGGPTPNNVVLPEGWRNGGAPGSNKEK